MQLTAFHFHPKLTPHYRISNCSIFIFHHLLQLCHNLIKVSNWHIKLCLTIASLKIQKMNDFFKLWIFIDNFKYSFCYCWAWWLVVHGRTDPTEAEYLGTGEHAVSAAVLVVEDWKETICSRGTDTPATTSWNWLVRGLEETNRHIVVLITIISQSDFSSSGSWGPCHKFAFKKRSLLSYMTFFIFLCILQDINKEK